MTIAEIVRNGKGRAGSGGAWSVETLEDGTRELWHYRTLMLTWRDGAVLDYATGWGSVSDQGGMNTAFRELGAALRYDRDERGGGPWVTDVAP